MGGTLRKGICNFVSKCNNVTMPLDLSIEGQQSCISAHKKAERVKGEYQNAE